MSEHAPEQRAPADQQWKGSRQRLHHVPSPFLKRARPHVADQEAQHRPAQHVGGKVGPSHYASHADEERSGVPEPPPFRKIASQNRGHGKRRRSMPRRKRIKPPLPRRAIFKSILMRPPRARPPDQVLEGLDRDSHQGMGHEPVDPGLLPHFFLPKIAHAPQPDAQKHQRKAVPQPVSDRPQA